MKYKAEINILPRKELLDPQGKTLTKNMKNLDISGISDIRVGKHLIVRFEAEDQKEADTIIESACNKLFHNPIMETYHYKIYPVDQ